MTDNSLQGLLETIAARALALCIPTFGIFTSSSAKAGGLVNYGLDPKEAFCGRCASFEGNPRRRVSSRFACWATDQVHSGGQSQDSQDLGIAVPAALLARADEVIE